MRVLQKLLVSSLSLTIMMAAPVSAQNEKQNLYQKADGGYALVVDKFAGTAPSCSFSMFRATAGMEFGFIHNQNARGGVMVTMLFNPAFDPGGMGNNRMFRFVPITAGPSGYFDQPVMIQESQSGFVSAQSGPRTASNQAPLFALLRQSSRVKVMKTSGALLTELAFPDAAMKQALDQFDGCVKTLN